MPKADSLINPDLGGGFPQAARGEGVYLYDQEGRRYLDGCAGALVANIGHGVPAISQAMAAQAAELSYVYRVHFSSAIAEELALRYCKLTKEPMGAAFFVSSGSEASEAAVRLARSRHLAVGQPERYKIITRWQSYHGITMGALAWSGYVARRLDYQPYLQDFTHIAPPYCYRCWFGQQPDSCGLECAEALDQAIRQEGPATVAAFMAEPVVGSALSAVCPPRGYLERIREICDQHGVLYIAEEVMSGAGRSGRHFFASDHFEARPDLIVFGKGVGGGYYPLAGVLLSPEMTQDLAQSGGFGAGQSYSGHPVGMAAGHAVLDYMDEHNLVQRAAVNGQYLAEKMQALSNHELVGQVRGMGLMWGAELVRDKTGKQSFAPELHAYGEFYKLAREMGLLVLASGGCDHGNSGDAFLLGPPLTISLAEIDEMVGIIGDALDKLGERLK